MKIERTVWLSMEERETLNKAMSIIRHMCTELDSHDENCRSCEECPFDRICMTTTDDMELGAFEDFYEINIRTERKGE